MITIILEVILFIILVILMIISIKYMMKVGEDLS